MSDSQTNQPPADEQEEEAYGLSCAKCGCQHLPVYYTRPRRGGYIVRVRQCRHCGERLTTREKVVGSK